MRRALKIILVILIILSLVAVSAWLLARKKAADTGKTQPTFKDFITRATPGTPNKDTTGGDLTLEEQETSATETGTTTEPESGSIAISRFTSSPLIPSTSIQNNSNVPGSPRPQGSGGTQTGQTSISNNTSVNQQTVRDLFGATSDSCEDRDLNIEFTPQEIARLSELQEQFTEIAGSLHSDKNVQNEEENYLLFKDKVDTVTELYNYCQSRGFQIATVPYKNRIATPFWRTAGRDTTGYLTNGPWDDGVADPEKLYETEVMLEQLFKLHFW